MTDDAMDIQGHEKMLSFLRDSVLVPNLETLGHNNVMLLVGNDFAYHKTEVGHNNTTQSQTWHLLDMYYHLLKHHGKKDLGVDVEVQIATASEYFEAVENEIELNSLKLASYGFDFQLYDENTLLLNPTSYRTVHRLDFWSGYFSNRGAHKALVKRGFQQLEIAENFMSLMNLEKRDSKS